MSPAVDGVCSRSASCFHAAVRSVALRFDDEPSACAIAATSSSFASAHLSSSQSTPVTVPPPHCRRGDRVLHAVLVDAAHRDDADVLGHERVRDRVTLQRGDRVGELAVLVAQRARSRP